MVDFIQKIKNSIISKITKHNNIIKEDEEVALLPKHYTSNDLIQNSNDNNSNKTFSYIYLSYQFIFIFALFYYSIKLNVELTSILDLPSYSPFLFNVLSSVSIILCAIIITNNTLTMQKKPQNKSKNILDVFCLYSSFILGISSQILFYFMTLIPFISKLSSINSLFIIEIHFSLYEVLYASMIMLSLIFAVINVIIRMSSNHTFITKFNFLVVFELIFLIAYIESKMLNKSKIIQTSLLYSSYLTNILIYFTLPFI